MRKASAGRKTEFHRPLLILCEGIGDKTLYHKIIFASPELHGKFDIQFPGTESDNTGGRGKFGPWLRTTAKVSPTFHENVKCVVIISDVDSARITSLNEIKEGLTQAGLPVPSGEGDVVPGTLEFPVAISIYLVPLAGLGSLDTLCASALGRKWSLTEVVQSFIANTPAADWAPTKIAKAKLHTLLAVTCETKPETSLSSVWQENPKFHIPLDSGEFDDLVTALIKIAKPFLRLNQRRRKDLRLAGLFIQPCMRS